MSARYVRLIAGILIALVSGCRRSRMPLSETPPSPPPQPAGVQVTLYFLREGQLEGDDLLAPEVRTLSSNQPEAVMRALLEGPQGEDLLPLLPPDVELRGLRLQGEVAVVDLSQAFADFTGGSQFAYLAVYSVVNTLTELPGVKRVQIVSEGKTLPDFAGVMDLTEPLERDASLIATPLQPADRP